MAKSAIRFAVGTPEQHSSSWIVWSNQNEVYIAARCIAGQIKVSLHSTGDWRLAFTQQYADKPDSLLTLGENRVRHRWAPPPELSAGVSQAFAIIVPGSETKASAEPLAVKESQKIRWFDPPPETDALQFTVALLAPGTKVTGWPGMISPTNPTQDVGHFELPNGNIVWVTVFRFRMPAPLLSRVETWRDVTVRRGSEPVTGDLRAALFGHEPDGYGWFLDLSMPLHSPVT